jgi:hypothetical protein
MYSDIPRAGRFNALYKPVEDADVVVAADSAWLFF